MVMNRISLNERIKRLRSGYPSDTDYVISAIQTLAEIPITIYLGSDSVKIKELSCLLGIDVNILMKLSYKEVALYISILHDTGQDNETFNGIIEILTIPLRLCYEERK